MLGSLIDNSRFKLRYMYRVGRNQLDHSSKTQTLQFEPRTLRLPRGSRVNRACEEGQGNIPHCMLVPIDGKDVWYKFNERGMDFKQSAIQVIPICALAPSVPRSHVPHVRWNYNKELPVIESQS
jgi:hypothetical protein